MQETPKLPTMAGVAEAAARSGLAVYRVRVLCAEGAEIGRAHV